MLLRVLLSMLLTCSVAISNEPVVRTLWTGDAPHATGQEAKDVPSVTVWLPSELSESRTDAAVIVCPGGGYGGLAMDHEGRQIAEWLNSLGVAAFVLDYRHRGKGYGHPVPRADRPITSFFWQPF